MIPMTYYLRILEPRVVKLKGKPLMLKRVGGMWKLESKNPDLREK